MINRFKNKFLNNYFIFALIGTFMRRFIPKTHVIFFSVVLNIFVFN